MQVDVCAVVVVGVVVVVVIFVVVGVVGVDVFVVVLFVLFVLCYNTNDRNLRFGNKCNALMDVICDPQMTKYILIQVLSAVLMETTPELCQDIVGVC